MDTMKREYTTGKYPSFHVLLGPTGCGKTKAMFDIARKKFSIYLSLPNSSPVGERAAHHSDIRKSLSVVTTPVVDWNKDGVVLVHHLVKSMLLGRLFALFAFIKMRNIGYFSKRLKLDVIGQGQFHSFWQRCVLVTLTLLLTTF